MQWRNAKPPETFNRDFFFASTSKQAPYDAFCLVRCNGHFSLDRLANRRRICYFAAVSIRACLVTIHDIDGVAHTVEVTAATLYEAVAQGLAALQGNEWVAEIARGLNVVKVSVADVRVEHEVRLLDFTKWLDKKGGSPREMTDRNRIRSILGMTAST
jgi:hypothetical protein